MMLQNQIIVKLLIMLLLQVMPHPATPMAFQVLQVLIHTVHPNLRTTLPNLPITLPNPLITHRVIPMGHPSPLTTLRVIHMEHPNPHTVPPAALTVHPALPMAHPLLTKPPNLPIMHHLQAMELLVSADSTQI